MGLCFGSLAPHQPPSTLNTPHYSGSVSSESKNVSPSGRTSSQGKSQFSEIESESVNGSIVSGSGQILETPNLKVFSFVDLKAATKSFKSDALLGEGGFGKVYKGWLDQNTLTPAKAGSGMVVAIKKLNPESVQGFQEWKSEINFLGRISHPNLVKLLGYCWDDVELLLVYEFMAKGSLENHLFRRNPNIEQLSWNTRLKIAIDAARGLAFLHTSEKQVIYRDFKASNILLDGVGYFWLVAVFMLVIYILPFPLSTEMEAKTNAVPSWDEWNDEFINFDPVYFINQTIAEKNIELIV